MAGGIFGDGQRGGIFGAKVDPRLLAELERRAAQKRAFDEQAANLAPSKIPPREMPQSFDETLTGTIGDVVYGAPVIGPAALGLGARIGAAGQALQGKQGYSQALEDIQTKQEQYRRLNPLISGSAQAGGSSIFSPAFGASYGAQVVGNAAMGGADALARGEDPRYAAGKAALAAIVPIPGAKGALKKGIRAYHGSPHDFERFDSSKIGTGEGAQAYGHGMYFAEREGVAKDYKTKLSEPVVKASAAPDVDPEVARTLNDYASGTIDNDPSRARQDILDQLAREIPDTEAFVRKLTPDRYGQHQEVVDSLPLLYKMRDAILADKVSFKLDKGHMYEVDIAADPEHFLDWDKPLSEQSPQVREAIKKHGLDAVMQKSIDEEFTTLKDSGAATGDALYGALRDKAINWKAGTHGLTLAQETKGASDALREAGIPGIRYLDQGSRTKGTVVAGDGKPTGYHNIDSMIANTYGTWEKFKAANPNPSPQLKAAIDELDARGGVKFNRDEGTRNFVVFDDKLISILRKYGLPISAAGLAALSQLHPQEAQAAQRHAPAASK